MWNPENTKIDWTDVVRPNYERVKKLLGDNRVTLKEDSVETRDKDGKFKSFVITV